MSRRSFERPRVYVIDDDSAVLESMAFLLNAIGYRCDAFSSGDEFLARIEALAPGCVVTDFQMPRIDGYELYSAMRSRSFDWPACLMSSTQQGMRARAKAHGFIAFLAKPVETNELIAVLDCSAELLSNEGA